ncbi:Differentially expressed in FDCP 8-like [Homarus americanus]|uniref:Differentially expressed in FDCP 8-like n=1 Tax=Homarus americanus TaxID=6706 RepID=A0A8J5MCQ5_HOMAM|nr:Differentially expressed in FDCP 8-like [Homarus americanus]
MCGDNDGPTPSPATTTHSAVTTGMGEVVHNVSYGVGDTVHNVTAGVKRLLTSPPVNCDSMVTEEECPGVLPATPRNSMLSPVADNPSCDQSPGTDSETAEEEAAINDELGLTEDHFSQPEDNFLCMSEETLERSIEKCKLLILQCEESTTRRRALVHKLIQLRLRLQETHDASQIASTGVLFRMSHQLQPQKPPLTRTSKQYCDKCAQIIWGVIHISYICVLCEYRCHGRCVENIQRRCASVRVNEDSCYILRICPEVGLSAQNYKCAECKILITNKNAWCEPRRCDYTGLHYCPACHWNSRMVMPARVIHNWDFEERLVSRQAKQFLLLMKNRPVLHMEKLNPHLFKFKLREDLLVMKQYLGTCRTAQESRMLRQLEERQHFVENAFMFSLQDLVDVNSGVCQGKGYICELCDGSEIIFPFDGGVVVCTGCSTVLHHLCYTSRSSKCPRCARQEARRKQESTDNLCT